MLSLAFRGWPKFSAYLREIITAWTYAAIVRAIDGNEASGYIFAKWTTFSAVMSKIASAHAAADFAYAASVLSIQESFNGVGLSTFMHALVRPNLSCPRITFNNWAEASVCGPRYV